MRRPNISGAGADLASVGVALAAGWLGAAPLLALLLFAAAVAGWAWTRRRTLAALSPARRVTNGALALAVLAVVLGGAYWIGLLLGGHT